MTEKGELLSRLLCLGTGRRKKWFVLVDLVCAAYEVEVECVLSCAEYFFCSLGCVKFLLQLEPPKRCTKKRLLKKALRYFFNRSENNCIINKCQAIVPLT